MRFYPYLPPVLGYPTKLQRTFFAALDDQCDCAGDEIAILLVSDNLREICRGKPLIRAIAHHLLCVLIHKCSFSRAIRLKERFPDDAGHTRQKVV